MFGKNFSSLKDAIHVTPRPNHPFIFGKQIRQHARKNNRNTRPAIRHFKADRLALAPDQSAFRDQSTNAEHFCWSRRLRNNLAGRTKEIDAITHRITDQRGRDRQSNGSQSDHLNASLFLEILHRPPPQRGKRFLQKSCALTETRAPSSAPRSLRDLTSSWRFATLARTILWSGYQGPPQQPRAQASGPPPHRYGRSSSHGYGACWAPLPWAEPQ
mmetsp:Transcript_29230/g.56559  ORF Transcript_29230/g.56559 Transcript_29230/m.56559 type:complete len:215 (+) Transcript_29230:629-1273(+)